MTSTIPQHTYSVLPVTFVDMIRGAGGYISRHRDSVVVIHIPGDLVSKPQVDLDGGSDYWRNNAGDGGGSDIALANVCDDVALAWLLGVRVVIVVSCTPQVTERLERRCQFLGLDMPESVMGVRVTDEDTLKVVKESAGYVRCEVERYLARALRDKKRRGLREGNNEEIMRGGNVVGGNFWQATPLGVRDGVDYVFSGRVRSVEEGRIRKSLDEGDIVLLTSLGSSPSGEMFSVASEGLASKVAASLKCDKIVYYLSSPFTLVREAEDGKGGEEKIVQSLRLGEAKEWLEGEVRPRN